MTEHSKAKHFQDVCAGTEEASSFVECSEQLHVNPSPKQVVLSLEHIVRGA